MNFNELITRIIGVHMILTSSLGISINFYMFLHFSKLQKTSFYILCSSKTISNSLSLLIYVFYIGPTNAFYTSIGPPGLEVYLNQALGFGLLLQGPITQCLIAINRFLVVCIFPVSTPKHSTSVTVVALTVSWIFLFWFSTLIGFPDYCRVPFNFPHVGFFESDCNIEITNYLVFCLIFLAVFTNFLNIIIALTLFCSSKSRKTISSESIKSRRKLSIRFFCQSCFQDWITVVDYVNNVSSTKYCTSRFCVSLVTLGFDVIVYGVDGLVMFLFNRKAGKTGKVARKSKMSDFMKSSLSKVQA